MSRTPTRTSSPALRPRFRTGLPPRESTRPATAPTQRRPARRLRRRELRAVRFARPHHHAPAPHRDRQGRLRDATRPRARSGLPAPHDQLLRSARRPRLDGNRPKLNWTARRARHSPCSAEQQRRSPRMPRSPGLLLLRYAERQNRAKLHQQPPRTTRPPPEAGPAGSVAALP